jgi:subtilisin family serine protease
MIRRVLVALFAGLLALTAMADPADDAPRQLLVMLQLPGAHFRPDRQYSGAYGDGVGRFARQAIATDLARRHGLTLVSDWPLPSLGLDCFVMALAGRDDADSVARALAHDSRVAWVQPMNVFQGQAVRHDDPLFPLQPAAAVWRLADLHELASGRGSTIAIIDSGVDATHPDLAGQVDAAENFVDGQPFAAERHGTAVAGIVAARADNRLGIVGVAPRSRLLALRACWQSRSDATLCTSIGLAKALERSIGAGVTVINLSLAGPPDRLLGSLIDIATSRGIAVVAARDGAIPGGGFPASHRRVTAVSDAMAPPAWSAPGRDIPAPAPGAGWQFVSGASYAAAHVSGLLALLHELGSPGATALVPGADGGIDACATLIRATGPRACACSLAPATAVRHAP